MRLLCSFVGGDGHFLPLTPIARAAAAAGHDVAFACVASMAPTVEAAGFAAVRLTEGVAAAPPVAPERLPLRPLDAAREDAEFRDRFVRDGARRRAPHALAACAEWQPDVLVCEETDFGGMIAAERLRLPYASLLVLAAGSFIRREVIGEALDEVRAEHGLPSDPDLAMLRRHLVLSPFPPSFRDPAYPLPATAFSFRPQESATAGSSAPSWPSMTRGAPLVYFTLGTVFNVESGDLFTRVLAGLRDLPVNIAVTVGQDIDPAELRAQPGNVHVVRWLAQDSILPHCDLVVSHGGSGSVIGALAHGRPCVVIPMGADQPLNAERCVQLGVARVLDPIAATPSDVRDAASTVLADPSYRRAAEGIRDEFAALPGPAHAVTLLERLAAIR